MPETPCCIHCDHDPGWAHITYCPTCQPESDEARDARSEQAHESRNSLHRDGTADND